MPPLSRPRGACVLSRPFFVRSPSPMPRDGGDAQAPAPAQPRQQDWRRQPQHALPAHLPANSPRLCRRTRVCHTQAVFPSRRPMRPQPPALQGMPPRHTLKRNRQLDTPATPATLPARAYHIALPVCQSVRVFRARRSPFFCGTAAVGEPPVPYCCTAVPSAPAPRRRRRRGAPRHGAVPPPPARPLGRVLTERMHTMPSRAAFALSRYAQRTVPTLERPRRPP